MNYRNKKIPTKLGHPIVNLNINEEWVEFLREDARDDFRDILYHLNKKCSVRIFFSLREKSRWIEDYTLALVRTSVGRTIGRFSSDAEYNIDYEAIITIGMDEKEKLIDKLMKLSKTSRRLLIERVR